MIKKEMGWRVEGKIECYIYIINVGVGGEGKHTFDIYP